MISVHIYSVNLTVWCHSQIYLPRDLKYDHAFGLPADTQHAICPKCDTLSDACAVEIPMRY